MPSHIRTESKDIPVIKLKSAVIGSGAASLNAAVRLKRMGVQTAIITEGLGMGTSANAGSDKQTYYRANPGGTLKESYRDMASALFSGGAMHGDIALIEASLSLRGFHHLADIGVPFPSDRYGNFTGYKTDHDAATRGTSAGPGTSIQMYECLLAELRLLKIPVYNKMEIIDLITETSQTGAVEIKGFFAIDRKKTKSSSLGLTVFIADYVIYGTGGPAGLYRDSVYPPSQTGSTGIALKAGCLAQNMTEGQFGIGALKVRWNLSGSYQQVIPSYFSCDSNGNNREYFLNSFYSRKKDLINRIFLKGYEWPFDPGKIPGSSEIDLLVYYENHVRKRRVFMDFRHNPFSGDIFAADVMPRTVFDYLKKSGAIDSSPLKRLKRMNPSAYGLFLSRGIDLAKEALEIAVNHQHFNGGISGSIWWESSIKNFFPVGECNGSHGIYRPGGSALNSGQAGGIRAAEIISRRSAADSGENRYMHDSILMEKTVAEKLGYLLSLLSRDATVDPQAERKKIQERMSETMGILRDPLKIRQSIKLNADALKRHSMTGVKNPSAVTYFLKNIDLLLTEKVILSSADTLLRALKGSRGCYIKTSGRPLFKTDSKGRCSGLGSINIDNSLNGSIFTSLIGRGDNIINRRVRVRPLPESDGWFEQVWKEYVSGSIFK